MRAKNVSQKIINVGELTLLPNEVGVIPEKYEKNPNFEALVEMDFLVTLKDKAEPTNEDGQKTEIPENLDKMKRVELVEFCEAHDIEVAEDDTKAILCDKIREALA